MIVGILGLGLIGGSLARAYAIAGHTVYAGEKDEAMLSFAMLAGAVHGKLDSGVIPQCDLLLLAVYPAASAAWLEENAPLISGDDAIAVVQTGTIPWLPILAAAGMIVLAGIFLIRKRKTKK